MINWREPHMTAQKISETFSKSKHESVFAGIEHKIRNSNASQCWPRLSDLHSQVSCLAK
jgi:hypothetical protein